MNNITYKFDFNSQLGRREELDIIESLMQTGGTTWISGLMKKEQVPGRTAIIETFRWGGYANNNSSYPTRNANGRADSAQKLLNFAPLEKWIEYYLEDFSLSSADNVIYNVLKMRGYSYFKYNIEVDMN